MKAIEGREAKCRAIAFAIIPDAKFLETNGMRSCTSFLLLTLFALPAVAQVTISIDFDDDLAMRDWAASPIDKGTQSIGVSTERSTTGRHSLRISGRLPGSIGAKFTPWRNWEGCQRLEFDIWIPKQVPADVDLQVYIKDRYYWWYETHPYRDIRTGKQTGLRKPGSWSHISLDISEDSAIWRPGGHEKSWDYVLYKPREFGFRFFSSKPWQGDIYIDNLRLSGDEMPLGAFDRGDEPQPTYELKLEANAEQVPCYEKFELTFVTDRRYTNPYDPEVVDVQGHFLAPDGQQIAVPGFFYQGYRRQQTAEGFERLIPVGGPQWKVRFAPKQVGRYRYYVTLRDALGELRSREAAFEATASLDTRGYLRVSRTDPRYFEFENGEFFFPMGINMRDGGDQAEAQKGTYDFDYFFQRFEEEGITFVRTWMAAWWGGIEWSDRYHSRFDGLGRYCDYNAWRLDYCVELAAKHNLFLELTLNSHGQLRRDKFDQEWQYNPLSVQNGGFLPSPAMFFTSEKAKEYCRKRYRYIVARWGYSQHIMAWDLWNEIDLAEAYDPAQVAAWHQEMARYLRQGMRCGSCRR